MESNNLIADLERTPTIEKRILEHRIEIDDKNNDNQWHSCCFKTSDKRLLKFISIFTISISVLIFSFYKLSTDITYDEQNTYIGLITLIIGIYIKSPVF